MSSVIRLPLGFGCGPFRAPFVNAYLVPSGDGWVVVDTGPPSCARWILQALRQRSIPPEAVRLILLTHGHFDHAGSALELQQQLPGQPPIAMHPADRPFVAGERWPSSLRPSCLTGALGLLGGAMGMALLTVSATLRPWPAGALDEVLWLEGVGEEETDLLPLCGIEASAVRSPGHSPGSITLHLRSGEAIVGDIISGAIRPGVPRPPALVDDSEQVDASLRRIAGLRPSMIYPGHGGPFRGEAVERMVSLLSP